PPPPHSRITTSPFSQEEGQLQVPPPPPVSSSSSPKNPAYLYRGIPSKTSSTREECNSLHVDRGSNSPPSSYARHPEELQDPSNPHDPLLSPSPHTLLPPPVSSPSADFSSPYYMQHSKGFNYSIATTPGSEQPLSRSLPSGGKMTTEEAAEVLASIPESINLFDGFTEAHKLLTGKTARLLHQRSSREDLQAVIQHLSSTVKKKKVPPGTVPLAAAQAIASHHSSRSNSLQKASSLKSAGREARGGEGDLLQLTTDEANKNRRGSGSGRRRRSSRQNPSSTNSNSSRRTSRSSGPAAGGGMTATTTTTHTSTGRANPSVASTHPNLTP
ncbi:hypothetical protein CSUI_008889, partial [Cystoisospora suis]